ncbi:glycosyltransferase family 2 protein [Calothrix sp. NIES-2098]|uniref:glycosyltransferase family 2 protein n=1 Tax=Calothrix sp. NIES-2098 TaxID=1954171 RepID=UPI000B60874F|nr:family 2 glycosyl transferase [Calothrix sp. NIES-2098]
MKLVSVIIPLYKAEKYIAATVQSVLAQTYKNFELLIIDDGSPDQSVEICQQFTDPRIKIIRQDNRGVAAARNQGIRESQGEYIAFLDADDLWAPTKLEKHVNHLENCTSVGISYSYSSFIDATGKPLGLYQLPKTNNITPVHFLLRDPIGSGSNLVARREVFEAIRFEDNIDGTVEKFYFDEDRQLHPSEDTECWLRISLKSDLKFEGIPEVLIQYRLHSGGYSHQFEKKATSWEKFLEKAHFYAPDLIAQWENAARAYQLTAIARRAVNQGNGSMALKLSYRALATYWRILLEEPRRTMLTLSAACLLFLLPKTLYCQMQTLAFETVSAAQKRRLSYHERY